MIEIITIKEVPNEIQATITMILEQLKAQARVAEIKEIFQLNAQKFTYDGPPNGTVAIENLTIYKVKTNKHGTFHIWQIQTGKNKGVIMACFMGGSGDYCLKGKIKTKDAKIFTLQNFLDLAAAIGNSYS